MILLVGVDKTQENGTYHVVNKMSKSFHTFSMTELLNVVRHYEKFWMEIFLAPTNKSYFYVYFSTVNFVIIMMMKKMLPH